MTSLHRAQDYIQRGRASWSVFGKSIRFLEEAQIAFEVRKDREREADEFYWNAIIRERKGNPREHELHFTVRVRGGFGSRMSGVEFRPCLVAKHI